MMKSAAISALCLLVATIAVPVAAVPTTSEVETGETINVPFDPPIGKSIRYRFESSAGPKGQQSSIFDCRFERSGNELRMHIRLAPAPSLGTSPPAPQMPNSDVLISAMNLMQLPLILSLSDDAEITGIANAKDYAAALSSFYDSMIKSPPGEGALNAEQKAYFKDMFDKIRAMPLEVQTARIVGAVEPILEFAATDLSIGDVYETELESESAMGFAVTQTIQFTLEKATADTAFLSLSASIPPEMLKDQLQKLVAGAPAGMVKDAETPIDRATSTGAATYEVSRKDGLLIRHAWTDTIEILAGGKTETVKRLTTLERLP